MIARLFVMAGAPQNGRKRGENVLRAMNALVRNLQEELVTVWEEVVPKLLAKLEGWCRSVSHLTNIEEMLSRRRSFATLFFSECLIAFVVAESSLYIE